MTRKLLLILWCSLAAATPAVSAERLADIPRLKAFATVIDDIVRIGDVIENAGAVADVAIFRSPDIGSTGSISSAKVLEAVRPHNLLIVDAGNIAEVEITRDSRAISSRDVEKRIVRALGGQYGLGDPNRFVVAFDREPRTFYVEPHATSDLQVVRTHFEPRGGRFDVTLSLPGSAVARGANLRFVGTLTEIVEVPMLARPFNRGEIVRESDVTFERRPRAEVMPDILSSHDTIVGLAARHTLRPGIPLRRTDLVRPEIVKRDEAVTMIYEVPGIVLTLRGKAMESGANGDVINVLNPHSKRIVQAVVSGPGRVTIASRIPVSVINTAAVTSQTSGQSE